MEDERVTIKIKDLPVVDATSQVNNSDRLMTIRIDSLNPNIRASTGVSVGAFIDYIIEQAIFIGLASDRILGYTEPNSDIGNDKDLYFQYDTSMGGIIDIFVKYEGVWLSLKGG